ncbi:hypothetical protein [Bradyrhizobium sp. AUGA SZCCT0042]|uniref:hypothetical protein n=1 Tax=Bradyrhizobium sp. AUGA SZCCT0042 TaxID=2807651 RepID=UPI001BA4C6F7|nr:hypothetical protein [Bradyrhizobium sp. AUGA SZCCT0042]MBR1296651.1 hypothetical protein [Bradyrhizobium sp. AUGA SZCCT0042]
MTFAGVCENAIGARPIAIAVLASSFSCEKENEWILFRRRNTALTLAAIDHVNVANTIVNRARLESWYRRDWQFRFGGDIKTQFTELAGRCLFPSAEVA